jgi:hypothetical protein
MVRKIKSESFGEDNFLAGQLNAEFGVDPVFGVEKVQKAAHTWL